MFENIWKCHIFTYFQTFSNIFTHFHGKNETVHFYYYTSKNFFREIATFGIRTIFHRSKKRVKIFENFWKFLKIIQSYKWTLSNPQFVCGFLGPLIETSHNFYVPRDIFISDLSFMKSCTYEKLVIKLLLKEVVVTAAR